MNSKANLQRFVDCSKTSITFVLVALSFPVWVLLFFAHLLLCWWEDRVKNRRFSDGQDLLDSYDHHESAGLTRKQLRELKSKLVEVRP